MLHNSPPRSEVGEGDGGRRSKIENFGPSFYCGMVPKKSNNRFNTSKSKDCMPRLEGSLPQSGVVRQAGRGLEFDGSVPQSGIVRRGG